MVVTRSSTIGGAGLIDALIQKGFINCATNPNYPAADAGHVYFVNGAGKIGGASGVDVEVGAQLTCLVDGTPAGTQAAVGANWNIGASSASVSYTNATAVPVTIGGVTAGETFAAASMTTMWTDLLYPYIAPTVTLALTPTHGTREYGDDLASCDLTPTTVKNTDPITTLTLSRSGVGVIYTYATPTPGGATEAAYTDATGVSDTVTYTATVGDGTATSTNTKTYTFQWKMYYGVSSDGTLYTGAEIMSDIATQNDDFATTPAKTYAFTPSGADYVYWAYPASFGAITTSIFNSLPMTAYSYSNGTSFGHATPTAITLTNASGGTADYYIIRSDNTYNSPATWQIA